MMTAQEIKFMVLKCAFVGAFFLKLTPICFAQINLSEFSSNNGTDWVEVYNSSSETINLNEYHLEDSNSNNLALNCNLPAKSYFSIDWSNRLNNDGDRISLYKNNDQLIDCVSYGDADSCSNKEQVDLEKLDPGEYGLFQESTWIKANSHSKADNSSCLTISPSPSSASSTPSSLVSNATLKINEVKDEDGNVLSSVKVYVDGVYLHHYTPEELTFCDGCRCDDLIDCGFGEHSIGLQKSGYENWNSNKTINVGDNLEVNALMVEIVQEDTGSDIEEDEIEQDYYQDNSGQDISEQLENSKPTVLSATDISDDLESSRTASFSGEVFGATSSSENGDRESATESGENSGKKPSMALIISLLGVLFLLASSFPLVKPKLLEILKRNK